MMAAATWMGTGVYVWGGAGATGLLNDGWIYDDYQDQWTGTSSVGAPSSRVLAGAVWTGQHVVVWGGATSNGGAALGDGSLYTPSPTDAWAPMSSLEAPAARQQPIMVWTGFYVLVWGGSSNGVPVAGGAVYNDSSDTWTPMSTVGAPPQARTGWAWAWTGSLLLLFGGVDAQGTAHGDGFVYDPSMDSWTTMLSFGGEPSARSDAFGVWTNGTFVVWDGLGANGMPLDHDGAAYDPVADQWAGISGTGTPSRRSAPAGDTGWSGFSRLTGQAVVLGGFDTTAVGPAMFKTDGGLYAPASDTWSAIAPWPSGASHAWGVAVWTGQEMVLWSGIGSGTTLTQAGDRFMP
jgi:N-acetylneuraminic acid mutarotase